MRAIPGRELFKFQATDREQCGILIDTPKGIRIVEVPNVHLSPESYSIRQYDLIVVKNSLDNIAGEKILGFFHTHLAHHGSDPSDEDLDGAEIHPDMENCVYQPSTGSLVWYGSLTEVATKT